MNKLSPSAIVQMLWNHCNVLLDDGLSYGDYPSTGLRTSVQQLKKKVT
jgi:type I restriction enzyme M protein